MNLTNINTFHCQLNKTDLLLVNLYMSSIFLEIIDVKVLYHIKTQENAVIISWEMFGGGGGIVGKFFINFRVNFKILHSQ